MLFFMHYVLSATTSQIIGWKNIASSMVAYVVSDIKCCIKCPQVLMILCETRKSFS